MLSKVAINKFKELYERRYGIELSYEDASIMADDLVNLYKTVYLKPKHIKLDKSKRTIRK